MSEEKKSASKSAIGKALTFTDLTQPSRQQDYSSYKTYPKSEVDKLIGLHELNVKYELALSEGKKPTEALEGVRDHELLASYETDEQKIDAMVLGVPHSDIYKWDMQLNLFYDLSVPEHKTFIKNLEKDVKECYEAKFPGEEVHGEDRTR